MEKMKKEGNYKTFVALYENKVAGFIAVTQVLAAEVPNGYLHIQGLAVQEELQHRGIGSRLLRHAEDYAKEAGAPFIILCSGVKRTDAHAFYERNGYDKDSYCFDKNIS